jgi:hypothetical protein
VHSRSTGKGLKACISSELYTSSPIKEREMKKSDTHKFNSLKCYDLDYYKTDEHMQRLEFDSYIDAVATLTIDSVNLQKYLEHKKSEKKVRRLTRNKTNEKLKKLQLDSRDISEDASGIKFKPVYKNEEQPLKKPPQKLPSIDLGKHDHVPEELSDIGLSGKRLGRSRIFLKNKENKISFEDFLKDIMKNKAE